MHDEDRPCDEAYASILKCHIACMEDKLLRRAQEDELLLIDIQKKRKELARVEQRIREKYWEGVKKLENHT